MHIIIIHTKGWGVVHLSLVLCAPCNRYLLQPQFLQNVLLTEFDVTG